MAVSIFRIITSEVAQFDLMYLANFTREQQYLGTKWRSKQISSLDSDKVNTSPFHLVKEPEIPSILYSNQYLVY